MDAHCLYRFDEPVSPHLAAGMAAEKAGAWVSSSTRTGYQVVDAHNTLWLSSLFLSSSQNVAIPTDDAFATSVSSYIRKCATGTAQKSHMYIETAGGES